MADVTGKISNIKSELKAATLEAQALGLELAKMRDSANGIDPNRIASLESQFAAATDKAAQLRDQINDTNEQIGVLTAGSKFEKMGNGIKDVAGKIASLDFEGAAESASRLVSISKTVNFSDAVKGVKDIGSTFISLGKALLTNPLFLIAGAIALAVTYSKELLSLIDGVSSKDEERLQTLTDQAAASKEQLNSISAQEETLKANGMSEEEILQLKIDQAKVAAADAKAQVDAQKQIRDEQVAASERNKKILTGIIEFITIPLQALLYGVDQLTAKLNQAGIISDETFATIGNLRDKFNDKISSLVFDPEQVKKDGDAAVKEAEKSAVELQNTLDGLRNKQKANREKAAADELAEIKKQNEEKLKLENELYKGRLAIQAEIDKLVAARNAKPVEDDEEVKRAQAKADAIKEINAELYTSTTDAEIAAVDARYAALQAKARENGLLTAQLQKDLAEQNSKEVADIENRIALEKENAKFNLASNALGAINALNEAFAGKNEKQAKAAFQVSKSLNLAQAAMSTYQAVNTILADPTLIGPARWISAGTALVTGLANVAKIARTKYDSKGSSNTAGGSGSISQPSTTTASTAPATPSFNLFGTGNGQMNNLGAGTPTSNGPQPLAVQVSISETEITKTQSFVKKVQESATL